MRAELTILGDSIVASVKGYVANALAAVVPRLDAVEKSLRELPKPERGEKGDKGDKGDSVEITQLISVAENVTRDEVTKAFESARVKLSAEISALPKPQDGRDGKDGAPGRDGKDATVDYAAVVAQVRALIPDPKDGRDVDMAQVRSIVEQVTRSEVAAAVAVIPKPSDGKDGAPGRDGDRGADGRDGKDADSVAITADVIARVSAVLDAIPVPKDGHNGIDGSPGRDGVDG